MKRISIHKVQADFVSHDREIKKKVILDNNVIPQLTNLSQAYFSPGQVAKAHIHDDMYEVFLVDKGHGVIRIDDNDHLLEAGVCVVVEPKESHMIENTGGLELVLTYFGIEA